MPEVGVDERETGGGGRPPGEREGATTQEDATETTVPEKLGGTLPVSTDVGQRGKKMEGPPQEQCAEEGSAASADMERQGSSPVVEAAAGDTAVVVKTGHPAGFSVSAGDDDTHGRAVQAQALPLVGRRRRARGKLEEGAGEVVWFDRTIVRVGARVPWGRLHRGRFAKVSNNISAAAAAAAVDEDPTFTNAQAFGRP